MRQQTQPVTTPTNLFNPDTETFVFSYDMGKQVYTLYAMSYDSVPKYIADKIAPLLADKIIGQRGVIKNHSLDKEELLREIYVR